MLRRLVLFGVCALAAPTLLAQVSLQYSADIALDLAGVGHDHDYFLGAPGATARVSLPGIPAHADLDALHIDANFDVLVSLDVPARVGGVDAAPGDVLRYRSGTYSLAFDASANGVPDGVDCDAVTRDPSGRLLLSFDRTFAANGTTVYRADVVAFDPEGIDHVVDTRGTANGLNVDAVHAESATVLLLSYDADGQFGGVQFADEDVVALEQRGPDDFTWTLRHDMSLVSSRWRAADLDALSATAVGDGLFKDGFE